MNARLKEYENEAVKLLRSSDNAILSTISKKYSGYPFGSFVTFISNTDRTIIIYASDLAEHTKNLNNNSKACITLSRDASGNDKQDSARLTLIGNLFGISDADKKEYSERFHTFLPDSKKYAKMHDFKFYRLDIERVRWIGGFGQIAWLDTKYWNPMAPEWKKSQTQIIEHMNEDHLNSIQSSFYAQHSIKDKNVKMSLLSIDGYYVESEKKLYFIAFDDPCDTMHEYRKALVKQAKEYRKFELK